MSSTDLSVGKARPRWWIRQRESALLPWTGRTPTIVGAAILAALAGLAIFGPLIFGLDPLATNPDLSLVPPSWAHPFGTDSFGRDILARVMDAARRDLLIPALIVGIAAPVGTILGVIAGYFGTWVDQFVMRLTDIVLAFPSLLLALVIVAVLGNGIKVLVIALAIANTPYFIRITRSRVLSERQLEYVDAAVAVGNRGWRVGLVHVLPNSLNPTFAQATLAFGWAILDTAGLAFLGVGIVAPTPEWGLMVGEGTKDILGGVWWTSALPGIFILLTALAANLIGSGLRRQSR